MAKIWRAENAKLLHIVDYDGAIDHSQVNYHIVEEICSSVIIPVEFAGGIRTLEDAKQIIDIGISRLVISTMAIENPDEFKKAFEFFGPKKICINLDILGLKKKNGNFIY